jgi:hypothetical protein
MGVIGNIRGQHFELERAFGHEQAMTFLFS